MGVPSLNLARLLWPYRKPLAVAFMAMPIEGAADARAVAAKADLRLRARISAGTVLVVRVARGLDVIG